MPIQIDNTNAGIVNLRAPASGTTNLTLPTADGSTGQALTTNGSGQLAFATVGGSKRVVVLADSATITINSATTDLATQNNTQSAGTLTIAAPTGSPVDGQQIMLRLTSINAQTFSWNAIFAGSADLPLPTVSTGAGKEDYLGFMYDSTSVKWHLTAKNFGF